MVRPQLCNRRAVTAANVSGAVRRRAVAQLALVVESPAVGGVVVRHAARVHATGAQRAKDQWYTSRPHHRHRPARLEVVPSPSWPL